MEGQTFLGVVADVAIAIKLLVVYLHCYCYIFGVIRLCPFGNTRFWFQSFVLFLLFLFVEECLIEVVLKLILLHFCVSPKRSLNYLNLALTRWFYKYLHFSLLLPIYLYLDLCDSWHLLFALAEVQTPDMKCSRDEVDKEKANDSSVDVDDVIDIYFEEADDKANNNHK